MSADNLEIVRRSYDATNRGDLEAGMAWAHDSIRMTVESPAEGRLTFEGIQAVTEFQRRLRETWEDYGLDVEELIDAGDCVLAVVVRHGRGRVSGAEVSDRIFNVWTFRHGAVVAFDSLRDRAEALALAGLTEQES
jgi:ketosteroid isomerase-like protein